VKVINDEFAAFRQNWSLGPDWEPESHSVRNQGVPQLDRLANFDDILVLGPISNVEQAEEFAGGLRLAVEKGVRATVLYPAAFGTSDQTFLQSLTPRLAEVSLAPAAQQAVAAHPAFYEYFGSYGRTAIAFPAPASTSEVLGKLNGDAVAIRLPLGQGAIYVLPFHVASIRASYNPLVRSILTAIGAYEADDDESALPPFVEDLRLPGEVDLLARIEKLREETQVAEGKAARLKEYRQMIGRASGDELERLVIKALNVVLTRTGWEARDRPDLKAEDFWIVEEGQDRVLAEVKGVGGSVNRQAVNQVDNHRAEHELAVEEVPGVLVINTFRNSDDEGQRKTPVSADVARHAVRLNVLVLRSLDLYFLLNRALAGEEMGKVLVEALQAGGGWLQVTESSQSLEGPS
jgi:hypothetical protein